jgi:hypothetical protein
LERCGRLRERENGRRGVRRCSNIHLTVCRCVLMFHGPEAVRYHDNKQNRVVIVVVITLADALDKKKRRK